MISRALQKFLSALALGYLATGAVLFAAPEWASANFAWKISPFVAMTLGGWCLGNASLAFIVARRNGLALTLGDLGQLVEREREFDSLSRINGQRAVTFNIFKQQDANIVATGEAVKAAMDEVRKTLPSDVELRLIYANSVFVKGSLEGL